MERAWPRRTLLGLPVDVVRRDDVLAAATRMVAEGGSHHLCALNPIKVMRAQEEADLRAGIQAAALVYPDAVGVAWALRLHHGDRVPVLPGCELMVDLLDLADRLRWRVFLVGAHPAVLRRMCRRLAAERPGIHLVGAHHGYFAEADRGAIVASIVAARPQMLLIAMGAHRQETFAREVEARGGVPLILTLGGSFDAFVGEVPRPPPWMLRLRLEWLYRLIRQPFRAPRMLALPRFALRLLVPGLFFRTCRLLALPRRRG